MTRAPNLRFCRARQNRISCEHGVNHWIPFAEEEVGAQDCFASHFMSDFLKGKVEAERGDLFSCGDRNVAAPADCGAVGTPSPTALDYYRSHELGKTWYDVADCAALSGMDSVHIDVPDAKADRNAVKAAFRAMKFVRNEADGRLVAIPVAAAKKLMRHPHLNVFGLAKDYGRLFAKSRRLWSELTAEISNHREHRNVTCYHQYVAKADWDDESVYVRFTVREGYGRVGQNELHGTMVSRIAVYKAKGAELSDPSHVQGEGSTPFVDNKIALFLSAVNGGTKNDKNGQTGFVISAEARAVLDAGRELWRYHHAQPGANPNASYYDIRKHFQGMKTTASGKEQMNATSGDAGYNERLAALKAAMKRLAAKIEPKVYEYGFLRK